MSSPRSAQPAASADQIVEEGHNATNANNAEEGPSTEEGLIVRNLRKLGDVRELK